MINITRFPVVIFASPRTGSTSLTHYIQKLYPNNACFCEPDLKELESFLDYSRNNNNYIVKLMAKNFYRYPNDRISSSNNFFIKIHRRSIIDQIASNYIARERNIWFYTAGINIENTQLPIDIAKIKENITIIKEYNTALNSVNIKFDLNLIYEDLPLMSGNQHIITPKPSNYSDIKAAIIEHL